MPYDVYVIHYKVICKLKMSNFMIRWITRYHSLDIIWYDSYVISSLKTITRRTSSHRMSNLAKPSSIWAYTSFSTSVKILSYRLYDIPFQSIRTIGHLVGKILHFKDWLHHSIKDRYAFPMLNVKYCRIFLWCFFLHSSVKWCLHKNVYVLVFQIWSWL